MSVAVSKEDAKKWIGQNIDAVKKDGSVVTGKLVRIKGSKLIFAAEKGKVVQTKALVPLVLFDLLAIGTAGAYGGYGGYGYGGYGGYPGGVGGYGGYPGGVGAPGYGVPGYGYGQPFIF